MARGRPLTPLDPGASAAAALGAAVRDGRLAKGLTLTALGALVDYSPQHLSDLERGRSSVTQACVGALDAALDADGALLALLRPAVTERAMAAQARAAARGRYDDDDVDPTTRLGLFEAGAATALGAATVGPAPARARDVDPGLVDHWMSLLRLLSAHDDTFGPREVLAAVVRELGLIAEHRAAARGDLRTELMRVEACWAQLAAWLSNDVGDVRGRDAWTDHALRLAETAGYADMAAGARMRHSQWAAQELDPARTVAHAEAGLRVPGAGSQTRVLCALRAARGHALTGDRPACERRLADAHGWLDSASPAPPCGVGGAGPVLVRAVEAHCWLLLEPRKAIGLYESVLRDWPRARVRDGGIQRLRLAYACAAVGERDRARAEGRRALAAARQTQSAMAARELRRLRDVLAAA
jgi:transcriptional regulator with XRE-family HTH domain